VQTAAPQETMGVANHGSKKIYGRYVPYVANGIWETCNTKLHNASTAEEFYKNV